MYLDNVKDMCIYHTKSDLTVIYPITDTKNIMYHDKICVNDDSNRSFQPKKYYVATGKVNKLSIKRTKTSYKYSIDGESVDSKTYNDFIFNFIYNEMQGHGYTMYSDDTPDDMIEEEYKAYLTISKSKLEKDHKLIEERILTDYFDDISGQVKFLVIDDIPFDKYITIKLPDGLSRMEFRKGLYVLDTHALYKDIIIAYCNKNSYTYDFPEHRVFEYDKINNDYISKYMKGATFYKQYFSYEDALKGKDDYINTIKDNLSIHNNTKLNAVTASKVLELLGYLSNDVKMSSFKVSGQPSYRSIQAKIKNMQKLIEDSCKTELDLGEF